MSKIRYLSHRLDMLARRINTRMSHALDLDLNGELGVPAENYQLMNYGIGIVIYFRYLVCSHSQWPGGFIELHIDSNSKTKNKVQYEERGEWLVRGERLMTFMLYLSEVTVVVMTVTLCNARCCRCGRGAPRSSPTWAWWCRRQRGPHCSGTPSTPR